MQRTLSASASLHLSHSIRQATHARNDARQRRPAKIVFTSLLCAVLTGCCQSGESGCHNLSVGPTKGEVIGVAVGVGAIVGTVIAIEVHHAHHTLNGCVSDGPDGMQLQTHGSSKVYKLTGDTATIKPGNRVRLHGKHVKQPKTATATPGFLVEHQNKDYGPCKVNPTPKATPQHS